MELSKKHHAISLLANCEDESDIAPDSICIYPQHSRTDLHDEDIDLIAVLSEN